MKRFICTVLIIALMLIMGVGCEKQKINSKTTSKADKSDKENSVNTQTPTADPTDALVAPTNDVESSQPPKIGFVEYSFSQISIHYNSLHNQSNRQQIE